MDALEAIVAVLGEDADVAALTEGRVYEFELPFNGVAAVESDATMPVQCVVVAPAGMGDMPDGWQATRDRRFDVLVYGADHPEALQLWEAVWAVLSGLTRRSFDAVALHWARLAGGPNTLRAPETTWPYVQSSWQVMYSA